MLNHVDRIFRDLTKDENERDQPASFSPTVSSPPPQEASRPDPAVDSRIEQLEQTVAALQRQLAATNEEMAAKNEELAMEKEMLKKLTGFHSFQCSTRCVLHTQGTSQTHRGVARLPRGTKASFTAIGGPENALLLCVCVCVCAHVCDREFVCCTLFNVSAYLKNKSAR